MNTRRIPFQFSTTDPLARQRELEKRFGLEPTYPKMYVDVNCTTSKDNISKKTSSPRFQHRVPIFAEGYDHPIHSSSVDSMASVPDNKKPNVRVIPIEVEGADSKSPRHRTYSGPAGTLKDNLSSERSGSPFKLFNLDDLSRSSKPKPNLEPRVYNIPVKVEGADDISRSPKIVDSRFKSANGCSLSKSSCKDKTSIIDVKVKSEPDIKQTDQSKNVEILLNKIKEVLYEFKTYESGVLEFNGTSKDKQYRYLDEMLTRCMLRLDDIDTMGNEEVRLARKNAVKKIQSSIDLLESKANIKPVEVSKVQIVSESSIVNENSNDFEMQDDKVTDNIIVSSENEASTEINDSKGLNEVDDHVMQSEESLTSSLEQQPDNIPEIEMSEETALNTIDSTNDDHSSEMLKSDNTVPNDVEMPDEKDLTSNFLVKVEESLSLREIAENKNDVNAPKISEVEMVDTGNLFKESSDKIESQTTEKVVARNFDCSEQKTNCDTDSSEHNVSVPPNDAEMEDIQSMSDDIMQSKTFNKCASNQSEKADDSLIIEEKKCDNVT